MLLRRYRYHIALTIIGALAFIPFLGKPYLFDWDELNFAECAREMLVTGDIFKVQIDYIDFYEKPPLFFWLQALSMKLFGVNEFAARFPNAIIGIFTLNSLFLLGKRVHSERLGLFAAGFFIASILPFIYFKLGMIDPVFNYFIFLGIGRLILLELDRSAGIRQGILSHGVMAGLWIGLATLTKGPVALLVTGVTYGIFKLIYDRFRIPWIEFFKFFAVFLLILGMWVGSVLAFATDGMEILTRFVEYQLELSTQNVAGHKQPFYYHAVVFTFGCFPMSALAYRGMFLRPEKEGSKILKRIMLIFFWVVMILFSSVKTKIIHYSSLLYFSGAFLAALTFLDLEKRKRRLPVEMHIFYGIGLLVFGFVISSLAFLAPSLDQYLYLIKDKFALANLTMPVKWHWALFVSAFLYIPAILISWWLCGKKDYFKALIVIAFGTIVYLNGLYIGVIPRVVNYTQGGAVQFFQSIEDEPKYVYVDGIAPGHQVVKIFNKAFTPFFYGKTLPHTRKFETREELLQWQLTGEVDRPVYVLLRITQMHEQIEEKFPGFENVYEKGGYVVLRRPAGSLLLEKSE